MNTFRYTVRDNRLLTPSVRSISLVPGDSTKSLQYEPGQYAAISLHDRSRPTATRCFSIASSPTDRTTLEFCARVGGDYTSALSRLTRGDRVVVRGPFGNFVFKPEVHRDLVLFAGGIGITPLMSMIRYASARNLDTDIHLVYSCRDQRDIPFLEELIKLERRNAHLRVTYVIGKGSTDRLRGLSVHEGRINANALRTLGLSLERATFMMCGPSSYLKAMHKLLADQKVSDARILSETFTEVTRQGGGVVNWPRRAYVLSGISLVAAGFFVVSSDVAKSLPTFQPALDPTALTLAASTPSGQEDTSVGSETTRPQVDTNSAQAPIVKRTSPAEVVTAKPPSPQPAPVPKPVPQTTPPPTPAPAPAPSVAVSAPAPTTKKVTTTSRPKTKVS